MTQRLTEKEMAMLLSLYPADDIQAEYAQRAVVELQAFKDLVDDIAVLLRNRSGAIIQLIASKDSDSAYQVRRLVSDIRVRVDPAFNPYEMP